MEDEKADESTNPEINPDILRIHAEISKVIGDAEMAGMEGNIDLVQVSVSIKVVKDLIFFLKFIIAVLLLPCLCCSLCYLLMLLFFIFMLFFFLPNVRSWCLFA